MRYFIYAVLSIAFAWLFIYLFQPVLNFGYTGFPVLILLILAGLTGIEYSLKSSNKIKKVNKLLPVLTAIALVFLVFVPLITSAPVFHAKQYRNIIGEVKMGKDFSKHVAPISTDEIRIIDESIAYRVGDKVLGTKPSLGSQTQLGTFNIQKVKGKLYWVAPLLHSGFFKWNKNKQGTPAYVMVSATNERDVRLVQEVNGKPVRIKYQKNAFFSDYLPRHIYFNGFMSKAFTDFTFEIDDEGNPFWVVTKYTKKVGFGGNDATGIIVVDAGTGEIKEYSIEDAPKWIDRIQPENFIVEQLNDWGEYVKGFWNFANEDKLTTTKGISLVYGVNNRAYWYTGLSSVGSDEGTVGFVLVDTRTKETTWYKQIGATEQAARRSAQGKVQEKGYVATFPITYNINGIPTYVMSLKDNAGLIKMIAMVSVEDYTIVGVGNNIKEALRAYKNALHSKGNAVAPNRFSESFTVKSVVVRLSKDIRNGNSFYYIMLKNPGNKIFVGSSLISNEITITQVGDSVKITYDEDENELVDISQFDNLNIKLQKTEAQKEKEEEFVE
ncbi:MAG: hypothetical protein L3J74_11745 [Bacteroidales bacterium]|nr:hypothetical protein [Bacteroidales bacterium]